VSNHELARLEGLITRVLRLGVALSAATLLVGLVATLIGGVVAGPWLRAGLILLMAIPVARIATALIDAIRRRDTLLGWSTAVVLLVMLVSLLWSLRVS